MRTVLHPLVLVIALSGAGTPAVTGAQNPRPAVSPKQSVRWLDRLVVDLVEAVVLQGQEGRTFDALVTDVDDRGARIQLCDLAVVARVNARGVDPGDRIVVRLNATSPEDRSVDFERVA